MEIKTTVFDKPRELKFDLSIKQCNIKNFYHFFSDGSAFCKQCNITAIDDFLQTKTTETQKAKYAALIQHPKVQNGGEFKEFKDTPVKECNGMTRNNMGRVSTEVVC